MPKIEIGLWEFIQSKMGFFYFHALWKETVLLVKFLSWQKQQKKTPVVLFM